jgi:uncharacterized membrane protein YdbT with pleckstrin-like domain
MKEGNIMEETLYEGNPAMFANKPILFIMSLGLIVAYGLGIVILIVWYLKVKAIKLTITNQRVILKKGLLSKHTSEIEHNDIKNIQVNQGFVQRMLGAGNLSVSSAGTGAVEINVKGIKNPESLKEIIRKARN